MADHFISGSGSNTSPYDTWAKAATSTTTAMNDVIGVAVAGENIYIDKTFTLTNTSSTTFTFPGTDASPNRVISATNTGSSPVAADIVAGATITTTGTSAQTWNGAIYVYGVTVNVATGTSTAGFVAGSAAGSQYWDNCSVHLKQTGGSASISVGSVAAGARITFNNTPVEFNVATQGFAGASGSLFIWQNTPSAITGSTVPTALFTTAMRVIIDACDVSAVVSGKVFNSGASLPYSILLRNCKTSGVSTIYQTPANKAGLIDAVISDSSGSTEFQSRRRYEGSLDVSTTVYNNASDGTTPHSWTVVTTGNSTRQFPFQCFEIDQWAAAGTFAASKVFLTSADSTLTNADVWVEVTYLGAAAGATPMGSLVTTAPATFLTTGTGLTASSPAWAHGSLGHDFQIAIPSFTTTLPGYVRTKIYVAKASTTVNIDPAVTIA